MDIIIYNEQSNLFEYSGNRPDFIPNNDPMQPFSVVTTSDVDICHSISFYTIVTAVVNALNYFQCTKEINCTEYIAGIIVSVLTDEVNLADGQSLCNWCKANADAGNEKYMRYIGLLKDIQEAVENFPDNDLYRYFLHFMAVKSSEIVRLLNSEKSNLRLGCSRWNRSVLAAYDPISFLFDEQDMCFILDNENDRIRITNLLAFTMGGCNKETGESIPGAFDALYFYTFINPSTSTTYICSSNLPYSEWASAQDVSPCGYGIKYKNYITGEDETIDTYENGIR